MSAPRRATFAPDPNGASQVRRRAGALVGQHGANGAKVPFPRARRLHTRSDLTAQVHRCPDPALMSPEARLAELGEILATGHRRLVLFLALNRALEAQCDA